MVTPSRVLSLAARRSVLRDLKNDQWTDFEFFCDDEILPVHRVVICPQSPVLAAAAKPDADGNYDDRYMIRSSGIDTVKRMIDYLYKGDYTYPAAIGQPQNVPGQCNPITTVTIKLPPPVLSQMKLDASHLLPHVKLVDLAFRLRINGLEAKALDHFSTEMKQSAKSLAFLQTIPPIYKIGGETGLALRQQCVEATRRCFGPGLAIGEANRELLDAAFATTPTFAKDVLSSCIIIAPHVISKKREASEACEEGEHIDRLMVKRAKALLATDPNKQ